MKNREKIGIIIGLLSLMVWACNKHTPIQPVTDLTNIPYEPQNYAIKVNDSISFPRMIIPESNPTTVEGIALGKRLFYDKILSSDSTMSCASCHLPEGAFTDNRPKSKGVLGIFGKRSSMSLENIGFFDNAKGLFWDGRTRTLEEQALLPVEDSIELHHTWGKVIEKLKNHTDYPTRFRKAFGITKKDEITKELAAKAIAQFERTLVSTGNSKYDSVARQLAFFTDDELDGFYLFFNENGYADAQCGHCHVQPFFTSNQFFNNGLDEANSPNDFKDKGLGGFTGKPNDNGKFRTPSLRNIALTAPYMHDGRFKTLEEVMEHYASGGHYAQNVDAFIPQIRDIQLTAKQKRQIIAFLHTLTDNTFAKNPSYQDPFK